MKRVLFMLVFVFAVMMAAPAMAGPTIVLDPGHSGGTLGPTVDPEWNMTDWEYDNGAENHEMFAVCVEVKAILDPLGYTILLTKTGPDDIVSKRARVNVAINNNADLFLSVHRAGYTFGAWGGAYDQRTTLYRVDEAGVKRYFALPAVAAESTRIAKCIITARRVHEGSSITLKVNNYTGRNANIPDGNLTITQLWNTRPALLLEAGVCNTTAKVHKYAQGIANGIIAALPPDGSVTPPPPPPPAVTKTGTVVNCNTAVNVRSGPGTSYTKLGLAPKGSTYPVLGQTGSWYKITYKGRTAYISASFLSVK